MTDKTVVVRISSSLYEEFKDIVFAASKSYKSGLYREELDKAIQRYIRSKKALIVEESRQSTHTQTQNPTNESQIQGKQYPMKFVQFLSRAIQYLNDCDQHYDVKYEKHVRVSREDLKKAIAHACGGIDRRTITKYQNNLTLYQIIKTTDNGDFVFTNPWFESEQTQEKPKEAVQPSTTSKAQMQAAAEEFDNTLNKMGIGGTSS